jgi:hypothetical protein
LWKLDEKLNQVSIKHQKKSRCFIQTPRFIIGESQKYLEKSKKFTHIFIDPSRRVNSSKVFLLKDCEPNILDNLELYISK